MKKASIERSAAFGENTARKYFRRFPNQRSSLFLAVSNGEKKLTLVSFSTHMSTPELTFESMLSEKDTDTKSLDAPSSHRGGWAERKFLWKLDVCLLGWAFFAYVIKMIDASNYKTAYASGMKEDVNSFLFLSSRRN